MDQLDVFDARVRDRAYRLWQEAGCPPDCADAFWHQAREFEMRELNVNQGDLERASKEGFPGKDPADFA